MLALGNWQLDRAGVKEARIERIRSLSHEPELRILPATLGAEDVLLRPVEVRGAFDPAHAIWLDNRVYQGVPGYYLLMPLKIEGGSKYVLVNRGWAAAPRERGMLPRVVTPAGEIRVRGMAVPPPGKTLELSRGAEQGAVWQNLDLAHYRDATGLDIQAFLIQQTDPADDGLVRDWPAPDLGAAKNRAYAFQWFGLAGLIAILYVVLNVKKSAA